VKIDINLSKANRKALKFMCLRLFSDFKKIKISKRTVTLKKRWYSMHKNHVQVVNLILLQIPQAINELYYSRELEMPFETTMDLANAVGYFEELLEGEDIIQYLKYQIDDLDMSYALNRDYSAIPILSEEEKVVERGESYTTRKIFNDAVQYFNETIASVIEEIKSAPRVVYINTEQSRKMPPIRAPGYAA